MMLHGLEEEGVGSRGVKREESQLVQLLQENRFAIYFTVLYSTEYTVLFTV